ncbi:MAG TPA: hypothetical protein VK254_03935, partial [Candidatus Bathyarchaeia archaeon]|nr:hypothetical protein [Candidatus Bathyarchaeia archaeon]
MIDLRNGKKISDVVISTALGHGGSGMFPYNLLPGYRSLMRAARKTGTTIFSKSATRHKRIGNFILEDPRTWKYVQRIRGSFNGMLNAYGLTNEGAAIEAQKIYRAREGGFSVIPNFFSEFAKGKSVAIRETLEAIEIYARVLGNQFSAVELNYSCPNSGCEIRANMENCADCTSEVKKAFPWLFVIAKIAYDHPFEFA